MKKWVYGLLSLGLVAGLAACSDDPSVDNDPKEQVTVPDNEDNQTNSTTPEDQRKDDSGIKSDGSLTNQELKDQMAELPFTTLDFEVTYADNKKYDLEYEQMDDNGKFEAEIVDEVNDKKLKGTEAFQALYTIMQDLKFSPETPREEALKKTFEAFQLNPDYKSLEVEYTLRDGTEKEFKDQK